MDWLLTLSRPEESQAVDGAPERKQQVVVSDKDGVVRGGGGCLGVQRRRRVRIG